LKKKLALGALFIVASLSITGCSATNEKPENKVASSASPTGLQTPKEETVILGDVQTTGIKASDSRGSYETTELKKGFPLISTDSSKIEQTAKDVYSIEEIQKGVDFATKFVSSQGMDSIALNDGEAGWQKWKKEVGPQYIYSLQQDAILNNKNNGDFSRPTFIINDPHDNMPKTVRDGESRIDNETVTIDRVTGGTSTATGNYPEIKYLDISGSSVATYKVEQSEVIKTLQHDNPSWTEEVLKKEQPWVYNKKVSTFELTFKWSYIVAPEGGKWKLAGFHDSYIESHWNNI
jgi:hypothetical protein